MPLYLPPNLGLIDPSDHGLKGWSFDPSIPIAGNVITAGTLNLERVFLRTATTIGSVWISVTAAGATLTNVGFALYSQAGTLLTSSVNANGATAAAFQAAGLKSVTFATPQTIPPGSVYVGWWTTGTTQPTIARVSSVTGLLNVGLAAPLLRHATGTTGLTTTAPGTMGTQAAAANSYWVGVS